MTMHRRGLDIGLATMVAVSPLPAGLRQSRDDAGGSHGVAVAPDAASAWTTGAGTSGVFHHS
jgi:hypothetical protein